MYTSTVASRQEGARVSACLCVCLRVHVREGGTISRGSSEDTCAGFLCVIERAYAALCASVQTSAEKAERPNAGGAMNALATRGTGGRGAEDEKLRYDSASTNRRGQMDSR